MQDAALNAASLILRLTRAGETVWGNLPGDDWTIFQANHSTYEPLEWALRNTDDYPSEGKLLSCIYFLYFLLWSCNNRKLSAEIRISIGLCRVLLCRRAIEISHSAQNLSPLDNLKLSEYM